MKIYNEKGEMKKKKKGGLKIKKETEKSEIRKKNIRREV